MQDLAQPLASLVGFQGCVGELPGFRAPKLTLFGRKALRQLVALVVADFEVMRQPCHALNGVPAALHITLPLLYESVQHLQARVRVLCMRT